MTYTIKQLERAHMRVHDLASHAAMPTEATDQTIALAHQQRIAIMNNVMARMFVFQRRTIDRDELDENVCTLIDYLLSSK